MFSSWFHPIGWWTSWEAYKEKEKKAKANNQFNLLLNKKKDSN
jgi:hypothetical protein